MQKQDIKSKLERDPFRPFVIELASGRQISIADPQAEVLFPRTRPELVIAFSEGLMHEFEIGAVLSLLEA